MKTSLAIIASVFVNCAFKQTVYANVIQPKSSLVGVQFATISSSINKGFEGGQYNSGLEENVKEFTEHWNKTGYKSLGEMVDTALPGCRYVNAETPRADVTGLTEMWYDRGGGGFQPGRDGPCSATINGVEVFRNDNCPKSFPTSPAKIPLSYASCKGDCMFIFYYVTLPADPWLSFKYCIPIVNGKPVVDNTPPNSPPAADTNGAVQAAMDFNSVPASGGQGTVKP